MRHEPRPFEAPDRPAGIGQPLPGQGSRLLDARGLHGVDTFVARAQPARRRN